MSTDSKQPLVFRIATIPGDGIGTDVTESAIEVLNIVSKVFGTFHFEFVRFDWSSENYAKRGWYMPEHGLEQLQKYDAIYFGAVGSPSVPDHISLWGLLLPMRKALNQYVNVRPVRILPGTTSPLSSCKADPSLLDWVIVRENSEGEYSGQGGTSHDHTPFTTATEVSVFTRPALERIFRFAFEVAESRPKKRLTMVTKSNAQRHGMVLWDKVFSEIATEYKETKGSTVRVDKMLVDAMTVRMVNDPDSLDTIVATNLHADILSDLAAALAGSIGIAPSSNLDPTRKHPSMFEPIHGSAPDIAGKGVANPLGAIWSAAEMVRWLGGGGGASQASSPSSPEGVTLGPGVDRMAEAADLVMKAVENVSSAGIKTRDLGGQSNTKEVTAAVCAELKKLIEA